MCVELYFLITIYFGFDFYVIYRICAVTLPVFNFDHQDQIKSVISNICVLKYTKTKILILNNWLHASLGLRSVVCMLRVCVCLRESEHACVCVCFRHITTKTGCDGHSQNIMSDYYALA